MAVPAAGIGLPAVGYAPGGAVFLREARPGADSAKDRDDRIPQGRR